MDELAVRLTFSRCVSCDGPIVNAWDTRTLGCRHVAHASCPACCFVCTPYFGKSGMVNTALVTVMGQMGWAQHLTGDWRGSIMYASTFGFLWFLKPFVWLTGSNDFVYLIIVGYLYSGLFGSELPACVALWVSGMYGFETFPLPFIVDNAVCLVGVRLFRVSDVAGSMVAFLLAFRAVWTWPRMWDVHVGNCCGAGSLMLAVAFASAVSATAVAGLTHETFDVVPSLHAWFIVRALFPRQTKDPFTMTSASHVRTVCWALFIIFVTK